MEIDLLLCDRYDHEIPFTVCAKVNIAQAANPMTLTNFFELCMPSSIDTAHLPRFTEFCNPACETRLATNNLGRDLTVCPDGTIKANLIIALCITCEKKLLVPVQLCVLSTGFVQLSAVNNVACEEFPNLYPRQTQSQFSDAVDDGCDCDHDHGCDPCGPPEPCDPCDDFDDCLPYPPQPPRPPKPQPRNHR